VVSASMEIGRRRMPNHPFRPRCVRADRERSVVDRHVETFLSVQDPADHTTGGGSASAIAGAMAGALAAMVAELSVNKKGMEPAAFYERASARARTLSADLMRGSTEDRQAYAAVRDAYRMPRETEEEKALRQPAVRAAWILAAQVPLANAERCAQVLDLAAELEGRSNPAAASDLSCAARLARAGLHGCLDNVEINLGSIDDPAAVEELSRRVRALRGRAAAGRLLEG